MSTAQLTLALPAAPRVLTPVRRVRGLLAWDSEPQARAWLARHHEYHRAVDGTLMKVKLRETRYGWLAVAWHSGFPYVLYGDKVLRPWKAAEVM